MDDLSETKQEERPHAGECRDLYLADDDADDCVSSSLELELDSFIVFLLLLTQAQQQTLADRGARGQRMGHLYPSQQIILSIKHLFLYVIKWPI